MNFVFFKIFQFNISSEPGSSVIYCLELDNFCRGETNCSCGAMLIVEIIFTKPLKRLNKIAFRNAGMCCPVFKNAAFTSENDFLFCFKKVFHFKYLQLFVCGVFHCLYYMLIERICQGFLQNFMLNEHKKSLAALYQTTRDFLLFL
nr:MAG TPA: hypothetical protein [Caudoviricetes sp.]